MVGNSKDIGFERCICLECRTVNGDMCVRSGAEDPVEAGTVTATDSGGMRSCWQAKSTASTLAVFVIVNMQETGDVGGWLDGRRWEIAPWV
jgi:hypothetical protein